MIETILPRHFDNTYQGQRLAVWLFALIVLVKAVQGLAVGSPPGPVVNVVLTVLLSIGLVLSLLPRAVRGAGGR